MTILPLKRPWSCPQSGKTPPTAAITVKTPSFQGSWRRQKKTASWRSWTVPTPPTTPETGPGCGPFGSSGSFPPCGSAASPKGPSEYSRNAGLFTWNKPAYACLATRVPTGCSIDPEILKKIERAETGLTRLGFSDFRVRVWKDPAGQDSWNARLQLTESQFYLLAGKRLEVLELLKPDFSQVLLDLSARSVTI